MQLNATFCYLSTPLTALFRLNVFANSSEHKALNRFFRKIKKFFQNKKAFFLSAPFGSSRRLRSEMKSDITIPLKGEDVQAQGQFASWLKLRANAGLSVYHLRFLRCLLWKKLRFKQRGNRDNGELDLMRDLVSILRQKNPDRKIIFATSQPGFVWAALLE